MAQNREKEETEVKVPENLPICTPPQTISSPPRTPLARAPDITDPPRTSSAGSPENPDLIPPSEKRRDLKRPRDGTWCSVSGCRKRIGLVGFRCRCGDVFCSEHRYSDRHDCSYDYKAAGREVIARENPVVRAEKLVKV